jgi:hypothetical protein
MNNLYFEPSMKRLIILFLLACPAMAFSQHTFPDYWTVVTRFFSLYHHDNKAEEILGFARKKDGWYVQVSDAIKEERPVSEQLFWSLQKGRFQVLANFVGANKDPVEDKALRHIYSASYNGYGFERCIYYGYNGWDGDIIKDFVKAANPGDTLLESLARAYDSYAARYLWYQYGGYQSGTDTLQRKLDRLELPGDERVKMVSDYIMKAAATYEKIYNRNKTYETFAGNIALKCFNEYCHGYLQLMMCKRPEEAKKFLAACRLPANDSIAAQNLLQSVDANAILFTGGDNDTYPLYYLQEQYNMRKDVTIVNTNMLGMPVYVDLLKRQNEISFTSTAAEYGKRNFDVMYFSGQNSNGRKIKLRDFISGHKYLKQVPAMIDSVKIFPEKNLYVLLAKHTDTLHIELRDYLVMNEFLVLDIIESNLGKRPVFFHGDFSLIPSVNLRRTGIAHQLVAATDNQSTIEEYMRSNYKPPFQNQQTSFSDNNGNIDKHFNLYTELILKSGDKRATDSLITEHPFGQYYPKEVVIARLEELKAILTRYGRDQMMIHEAIHRISLQ